MDRELRVLHVTEASSAGVLHSAGGLARRQAQAGARVTFAYIRRGDSPPEEEVTALLGDATGVEFGSADLGTFGRVRAMRVFIADASRRGHFEVIHAHSSLAGAALRVGLRLPRYDGVVAYSPHGFAFLREDVPRIARRAFRLAEMVAARRGVIIAASPSEAALARKALRPRHAAVAANGIEAFPAPRDEPSTRRPKVGIVGRITYQKAPWRFASLARSLSAEADFIWIGDGLAEDRERWIGDAPVTVTGWLTPEQVREHVAELSVFCFPTLWEGMPLSLLEAQAAGVPAVATRIVGNEDIVVDGETGYLADSEDSVLTGVRRLLADPPLRRRMGANAMRSVRERFDARESAAESLRIYRQAAQT